MWLGSAAGLILLTWILARPIHARNVSVNDQLLTYDGHGWRHGAAPQACRNISQTVHTTNTTGDFIIFNFTGTALSVRGPITTLSTPMTVIIDGDIKPVAPPVVGADGCGILFNSNISGSAQQHMLTMVFAAASGSVAYSISGITVNVPDVMPSPRPVSTQFLQTPSSTFIPNSTATTSGTTSSDNFAMSMSGSTAHATSSPSVPSAPSATDSAAATSPFVTTPHMTITIIGAIIGAIFGMLGLLGLFVLLRRRIRRASKRKRDQETSLGGDLEKKLQQDVGTAPLWSPRQRDSPQFASGRGAQGNQSFQDSLNGGFIRPYSNIPSTTTSLSRSVPASVMSVSETPANPLVSTAYPRHVHPRTGVYDIPLESVQQSRSPVSDFEDEQSLSMQSVQSTLRLPPPPIKIPLNPSNLSFASYEPTPGNRTAATLNSISKYSATATIGEGDVLAHERRRLRVINRSRSMRSVDTRSVDPPPRNITQG